ncbi:MAG: DUF1292 domain-containing protein [Clostridiales bacterium]|nr:DUF1292 domain-containing protein [Clostridiales bacterium]
MEENYEGAVITLIADDGTPIDFEHVLTFMYDNERYMALTPAIDTEDEEADIVFMRVEKVDGEDGLAPIENEVLLDELFEVFCDLMEGEDGDDSEDDGEDEEEGEDEE